MIDQESDGNKKEKSWSVKSSSFGRKPVDQAIIDETNVDFEET